EARKLLADIEVEEQNHAEMMFRYKTVNSMC
ncbi:MAG: ferritin-like domain-containing protein, partial [Eubacteriales bacterium]|nr:ferritin-like domain-containing protein [Eubacteriales bacterium]MDY5355075.1 ferritin-like domain-containing protein [Eubacteriales bacterium]